LSSTVELISGVVQCSGIGPLMFLIFINELAEIPDRAGVKVKLFADDIKVCVQIVSSHDSFKLQCALDLLTSWAQTWQLNVRDCSPDLAKKALQYINNFDAVR